MIKKIELKNFKCFENLSVSLTNLNLFSGINSMGKSTVIQSLLLLRQAYEKRTLDSGIFLNGEYTQIGTGYDLIYYNNDTDEIGISVTDDTEEEHFWCIEYKREADFLKIKKDKSLKIDKKDNLEEKLNLLSNSFEYIVAERLGPRKSYEKSFYDIQIRNHVGKYGEHAVYYLEKHAEESVGTPNVVIGEDDSLKYQTEQWMNLITPGIQFEFHDVMEADAVSLKIRHEERAKEMGTIMEYKPVNVGFGVTYTLPIIVAILKAKPGELVILENPEAHLHPRGQRKIGELISLAAQGGVQIIVETHSDHILNGIRLCVKKGELDKEHVNLFYFCVQNEDDTEMHTYEAPKIDEKGKLDFWPEGFFDEWDNTLLELL